jgi:hypothetical protein
MVTTPGTMIGLIRDAVVNAFRTEDDLTEFVRIKLNLQLALIAVGDNLGTIAFRLVERLDGEGRLPELLEKALAAVPDNVALRRAQDEFTAFVLAQKSAETVDTAPQPDRVGKSADTVVAAPQWAEDPNRPAAPVQAKIGDQSGATQAASVERWVTVGLTQVEDLNRTQDELRTFIEAHIEAIKLLRGCEHAQQTVMEALLRPAQAKQMEFWLEWRRELDGLRLPRLDLVRGGGRLEHELTAYESALADAGKAAESGRLESRERGADWLNEADRVVHPLRDAAEDLVEASRNEAYECLRRLAKVIEQIRARLDFVPEGQGKIDQKPIAPTA